MKRRLLYGLLLGSALCMQGIYGVEAIPTEDLQKATKEFKEYTEPVGQKADEIRKLEAEKKQTLERYKARFEELNGEYEKQGGLDKPEYEEQKRLADIVPQYEFMVEDLGWVLSADGGDAARIEAGKKLAEAAAVLNGRGDLQPTAQEIASKVKEQVEKLTADLAQGRTETGGGTTAAPDTGIVEYPKTPAGVVAKARAFMDKVSGVLDSIKKVTITTTDPAKSLSEAASAAGVVLGDVATETKEDLAHADDPTIGAAVREKMKAAGTFVEQVLDQMAKKINEAVQPIIAQMRGSNSAMESTLNKLGTARSGSGNVGEAEAKLRTLVDVTDITKWLDNLYHPDIVDAAKGTGVLTVVTDLCKVTNKIAAGQPVSDGDLVDAAYVPIFEKAVLGTELAAELNVNFSNVLAIRTDMKRQVDLYKDDTSEAGKEKLDAAQRQMNACDKIEERIRGASDQLGAVITLIGTTDWRLGLTRGRAGMQYFGPDF